MIVFYSGEGNIVNKYIYSSGLQKIDKKEGKKKKKTGNNKILGYIKEAPHCFLSLWVVKRERGKSEGSDRRFCVGTEGVRARGPSLSLSKIVLLKPHSTNSNPNSFFPSFFYFWWLFPSSSSSFFLFDFLNLLICRFYFIDAFGLYILINHHLHLYLHKNQKTLIGNGYHHGWFLL